jgi:hypothetical protein
LEESRTTIHRRPHDGEGAFPPVGVRRKATGIKRGMQIYMGERPAVFFAFHRLKRNPLAVQPTTQLVIEGFPRSANTFAVWAFRQAQQEEVPLAHHLHYPAQVIRAAQWQIPLLVLIRKPEDAVTSLIMRRPLLPVEQALKQYVSFYGIAAKYRDAFVLGRFEEVTEDYGAVIERINDKFATRFSLFDHTEENVKRVYARIEERHRAQYRAKISEARVARPSAIKEAMKREVRPGLVTPKQRKLLAEADTIYDYLTSR